MAPVFFEEKDSIGYITLNRPDKLNSFNREMCLLLQETLDKCKSPGMRAVYITGAGKGFCAGQDLAEAVDPVGPGMSAILVDLLNPIVTRIRKLEKPVIAAVNGVAAGAGANMAFCCDIVLATASANFIQAFSKIGLIPDTGGTYTLPRLIGWQKASALMMLGDKVTAEEAERFGMIYKVFKDESFMEESKKIAQTLSHLPTKGLALTKKILQLSLTRSFEEQLEEENIFQQQAGNTKDFKEGVDAFLEKRQPLFRGE